MSSTTRPKIQKKAKMPILIEPLIQTLNNIQLKIDAATGAATALELRLRIIAQLEPKVQPELKKKTPLLYYKAKLFHLIDAILEVFQDKLNPNDQEKIKKCRPPRNKLSHASLVEFMISLCIEANGREIDLRTGKGKPLPKNDLIEGAKCVDRLPALEEFSKRARAAIQILDEKILRTLNP